MVEGACEYGMDATWYDDAKTSFNMPELQRQLMGVHAMAVGGSTMIRQCDLFFSS